MKFNADFEKTLKSFAPRMNSISSAESLDTMSNNSTLDMISL